MTLSSWSMLLLIGKSRTRLELPQPSTCYQSITSRTPRPPNLTLFVSVNDFCKLFACDICCDIQSERAQCFLFPGGGSIPTPTHSPIAKSMAQNAAISAFRETYAASMKQQVRPGHFIQSDRVFSTNIAHKTLEDARRDRRASIEFGCK